MKLFSKIREALGDVNIIAEDLGFLTQAVYDLLRDCGYPGMKILQFGFDPYGNSEYAPHNYTKKTVVYPGTHDNSTLLGWYQKLRNDEREYFNEYLQITNPVEMVGKAIKECLKSVSDTCVVPLQDYLGLDDAARFNIPSTLGGNWVWRFRRGVLTDELAGRINRWTKTYRR
jgi:4-alpha-glucanotransferase